MKTKIISFIIGVAFITTAFDCNPEPIGCKHHHTLALLQELQGRYQSDDGYTRLTLDTNGEYTLSLGGTGTNGNYRINEFSYVELHLITGSMNFEIHRNPNGQIIGLTEALNGDPVLHRMGQEEPFISYNNLDIEVIRQNLGGRYSGISNGQHTLLELDNVYNSYYMQRDGQDYFGYYDTERTTFGILLVLHVENRSEEYYVHIIENSIQRITSRNIGIQEGLLRETPPLQVSEFHTYTDVETDQVRQNLIGEYSGTLNNEIALLNIRANNTMDITINGATTTFDYMISFIADGHPSLVFERNGVIFTYQIVFVADSHTEISRFNLQAQNSLLISHFDKIENNENEINHYHDEH